MSTAKALGPTIYTNAGQPAWGRGVASEVLADRTTYVFEHVGERTFMHGSKVIVELTLPADERQELATRLLRHTAASAGRPAKTKVKAKAKTKTKAKAETKAERADDATE